MEFSKKIVVWALIYTTVFSLADRVLAYCNKEVSGELIGLTAIVISGVIISYMNKAGKENMKKIAVRKEAPKCQNTNSGNS